MLASVTYEKQIEKFWARANKKGLLILDDNCWEWTGSTTRGYGNLTWKQKNFYAHRFSYGIANGYGPFHLILHRCDNPLCINPSHLYEGTHGDNIKDTILRGKNFYTSKTHCLRGHAFDEKNTYVYKRGHRTARVCRKCISFRAQNKRKTNNEQ